MTNNNVNVSVVQEVTNVNIENAPDQLRHIVTVDEQNMDVFVAMVGAQGRRGSRILSGVGPPASNIGQPEDIYIDLTASAFWGPKTSSGWPGEPFWGLGITLRYIHTQATPSDTWTIEHPLFGRPSVTVVDSASTTVIGEVSYVSDYEIVVSFTAPFSGYAYLT